MCQPLVESVVLLLDDQARRIFAHFLVLFCFPLLVRNPNSHTELLVVFGRGEQRNHLALERKATILLRWFGVLNLLVFYFLDLEKRLVGFFTGALDEDAALPE